MQYVALEIDDMASLDEVYFMGDHTYIFSIRASAIARSLSNFSSVAVLSISDENRKKYQQEAGIHRRRRARMSVYDAPLKLSHTYLSVRDERDHVVAHLGKFKAAAGEFGDGLSRRTLYARLKSVLSLDRTALIELSRPASGSNRSHHQLDSDGLIDYQKINKTRIDEYCVLEIRANIKPRQYPCSCRYLTLSIYLCNKASG